MKYPRAFVVIDKQKQPLREKQVQTNSGITPKIYIPTVSKTIQYLDQQASLIAAFDEHFYKHRNRDVVVLNTTDLTESFLPLFFSDRNMKVYWIDSKSDHRYLTKAVATYQTIQHALIHAGETFNLLESVRNDLKRLGCNYKYLDDKFMEPLYRYGSRTSALDMDLEILRFIKNKVARNILKRLAL